MGLFDRIGRLLGVGRTRAALPAGAELRDGLVVGSTSGGRSAPRRGTRELIASYRDSPWLRAATRRIATGVAGACWELYAHAAEPAQRGRQLSRRGPGGVYLDAKAPAWRWGRDSGVRDRKLRAPDFRKRAARRRELAEAGQLREVTSHPALDVLDRPNPFMTGAVAIQLTQTWLDIKGEAFWLLVLGAGGLPTGFLPVPPHWVQQVPTDAAPYYLISFAGLQLKLKPEAVVWFRDPDPEQPYGRGTGTAESLGDELETDEAAAKFLKNWFYNSAMPSLLVGLEDADKSEVERAKVQWEEDHRGAHNAHRAHFASGKMNAVRLDSSFRDQQIIDLRKLSRDTIAQVFAVPPEVLGIIENSNRATIDAARFIYVTGVEWPRVQFLRGEIQVQFIDRWDDGLCLEAEVQVPDDEGHKSEVMKTQPGAFSLNEWRAEAGYPPEPAFDGVYPSAAQPGQAPAGKPGDVQEPDPAELEDGGDAGEELSAPLATVHRLDPPWARRLSQGERAASGWGP